MTASAPQSMICLELVDTKIPRSPAYSPFPSPNGQAVLDQSSLLDLRSSEARFITGSFNNRVTRLTSRREPRPTAADVVELDEDMVKWEKRVRQDHRLVTHQDTIYTTTLGTVGEVFVGQQIFYVSLYVRRRS